MEHPVYLEEQDELNCGVHALNHLVQRKVFTPAYLNALARECKQDEIRALGFDTGYDFFYENGNYDVAVLQKALKRGNLEMVEIKTSDPRAKEAINRTAHQNAYICQRNSHWFTLRKFDNQWFEFNSLPLQVAKLKVDSTGDHLEIFSTEQKRKVFSGIYAII